MSSSYWKLSGMADRGTVQIACVSGCACVACHCKCGRVTPDPVKKKSLIPHQDHLLWSPNVRLLHVRTVKVDDMNAPTAMVDDSSTVLGMVSADSTRRERVETISLDIPEIKLQKIMFEIDTYVRYLSLGLPNLPYLEIFPAFGTA